MTGSGLQPGDAIPCKRCGEVHVLKASDVMSTSMAAREMLFCLCPQPTIGLYYVGNVGGQSNRGPVVEPPKTKGVA